MLCVGVTDAPALVHHLLQLVHHLQKGRAVEEIAVTISCALRKIVRGRSSTTFICTGAPV